MTHTPLVDRYGEPEQGRRIVLPGADLVLFEHCFVSSLADVHLRALADGNEIEWRQELLRMYGKEYPVPRLTAWYGDPDARYTYSGIPHEAQPWTASLRVIRQCVQRYAGVEFNSVLLNLYRDGADGMGWHSDDEPELGAAPVIASVSFGQPRRFRLRHKLDHSMTHALVLGHGSLLLMRGDTQRNWQHQVPKSRSRKRPLATRVNLTFRSVRPSLCNS